jgi:5-methylcytosine-specific restriction endonuclease McrA
VGAAGGAEAGGAMMGVMLCRLTHPETQEVVSAQHDAVLSAELDEWKNRECRHRSQEIRSIPIKNGIQIKNVCLSCGERLGDSLATKNFPEKPEIFDAIGIHQSYLESRDTERFEIVKRHQILQGDPELAEKRAYSAYLKSAEWEKKRQKVFKRDGNLCQGCRENTATEIHHLSYDNKYSEMIFQLVAVCEECHSFLHYHKYPQFRPSINRDLDNMPCYGCRWRSEEKGRNYCLVHEVPALSALRTESLCNNGKNGFEGLR